MRACVCVYVTFIKHADPYIYFTVDPKMTQDAVPALNELTIWRGRGSGNKLSAV